MLRSRPTVMALPPRRRSGWWFAAAVVLAGATASADPMDLSLNRLSYYNNGIERRLTDVHGHVIKDVLA